MGACSISMTVAGDKSKDEVLKAFRQRQADDRSDWLCDNDEDDEDGYTGDFQTVNSVKFSGREFDNEDEAYEFCLDTAQKWDYVVATKVVNPEENKNFWLVAGWGAE